VVICVHAVFLRLSPLNRCNVAQERRTTMDHSVLTMATFRS
jgi:hypothetical protein